MEELQNKGADMRVQVEIKDEWFQDVSTPARREFGKLMLEKLLKKKENEALSLSDLYIRCTKFLHLLGKEKGKLTDVFSRVVWEFVAVGLLRFDHQARFYHTFGELSPPPEL